MLCLAGSLVGLGGCAAVQSGSHRAGLMKIQIGMSREELIALMGPPDKREAYGDTEFLMYLTDFAGTTEVESFTPVALIDSKIVGWGRNYYVQAVSPRAAPRRVPGAEIGSHVPDIDARPAR